MHLKRSIGLYVAVFLPTLVFVLTGASSLSAGAAIACLIAMALYPPALRRSFRLDGMQYIAAFGGIALVIVHLSIAATFQPVNWSRAIASLAMALVFILGSQVLSRTFLADTPEQIDRTCRHVFLLMTAALIIGILGLIPSEVFGKHKVIFPFSEPSHFALAYTPFLMYSSLRTRGWQRFWIVLGAVTLGYLVQNLTMMAACLLVVLVCIRTIHLPWALGLLALGAASVDLTYFTTRLALDADSENLSALVYLQGWQLMDESLERSSNFGLGFQQLGERPTEVLAAALIYQHGELEMNLNDGGFLASKIVSEFGFSGIALVVAFSVLACWVALRLRAHGTSAKGSMLPAELLSHCTVLGFALDVFVRGTGYFSGTSLLFLTSSLYLLRRRRFRHPPKSPSLIGADLSR